MIITSALSTVLLEAIAKCYHDVPPDKRIEEHGGWILKKGDEYKFFFLRNDNSGLPLANVLFTANRQDIAKGPLGLILREGWQNFGTFHTHPQFSITPSTTDWNFLFQNSPQNFIYSPATLQLGVSTFLGRNEADDGQRWQHNVFDVVHDEFIPATRVRKAYE